jgi:hypothetical protein
MNRKKEMVREIKDPGTLEYHAKLLDEVAVDAWTFERGWLKDKNWTVVPTPDEISTTISAGIYNALHKCGIDEVIAISKPETLDLNKVRPFQSELYVLNISPMIFHNFRKLSDIWYKGILLTCKDRTFAILMTPGDYYLFAGTESLLRSIFDSDLLREREFFRAYIEDFKQFPGLYKELAEINRLYNSSSIIS